MRFLIPLLPVLLSGCIAEREAAVSNSGRVASTSEGGTFVEGQGRIGERATDIAWSPDGQTLAFAGKEGTTLWPSGKKIPNMVQTLSWSPDGKSLAGVVAYNVGVYDLETKKFRETQTIGIPTVGIRWMPDGRVLEVDSSGFQVEGLPRVIRGDDKSTDGSVVDATPQPDGSVIWMEVGNSKTTSGYLQSPLRIGRWNAAAKNLSVRRIGELGSVFSPQTPSRLSIPTHLAFAPGGSRYAVAGMVVEAGAKSLAQMKSLADKEEPTALDRKAFNDLARIAHKQSVVFKFDLLGNKTVLWSQKEQTIDAGPTDLSWSADGKWLAIARLDGTIRVAAGD